MTVSLVAVFVPVLFMGGIVGRLLNEFAVTIGVAIIVSGFVSISLTPMLCSRFLKPSHSQKHGRFYNLTERMFDGWLRAYDRSLRWSLRFRRATMVASFALMAATVYLFMIIPKGFLPTEDQGRFNMTVEGIQGIGFDDLVRHQFEVTDIIGQDPDIAGFNSNVGVGGGGGGAAKPGPHRRRPEAAGRTQTLGRSNHGRSAPEARAGARRPRLHGEPAADQPGRAGGGRSTYQFTLQDTDTAELYRVAPLLEDKMRDCRASTTSTAICG